MSGQTPRFRLTTLDSGTDPVNLFGYKFTDADRRMIDRLLVLCEAHRHTGQSVSEDLPAAPEIYMQPTGGVLPANSTVFYRYGLVDDRGQEQVASAPVSAITLPQLSTPPPPTLTLLPGVLTGGPYIYAISAYTNVSQQETRLSTGVSGTITGSGAWGLTFPTPPSGTDGYNFYRKGPTDRELYWVGSAEVGEGTWVDDGATADALRPAPRANTTSTSSAAAVTVTGIPTGWLVRLYRTLNSANWVDSLVTTVPEDFGQVTITDTGHATNPGSPVLSSAAVGTPPLVDLAEATTGAPPMAMLATHATLTVPSRGVVVAGFSPQYAVNEFDAFDLVSARAVLSYGTAPSTDDIILGIQFRPAGSGSWSYIYDGVDPLALTISVGEVMSAEATIDPVYSAFTPGALFRFEVSGTDSGNTAYDLSVELTGAVQQGSATTSYVWKET